MTQGRKAELHYKSALCLTAAALAENPDISRIWEQRAHELKMEGQRTPAPVYYSGCRPWPCDEEKAMKRKSLLQTIKEAIRGKA